MYETCYKCGQPTIFIRGTVHVPMPCPECAAEIGTEDAKPCDAPPQVTQGQPAAVMLSVVDSLRWLSAIETHHLKSPTDAHAVELSRELYHRIRAVDLDKLNQKSLF